MACTLSLTSHNAPLQCAGKFQVMRLFQWGTGEMLGHATKLWSSPGPWDFPLVQKGAPFTAFRGKSDVSKLETIINWVSSRLVMVVGMRVMLIALRFLWDFNQGLEWESNNLMWCSPNSDCVLLCSNYSLASERGRKEEKRKRKNHRGNKRRNKGEVPPGAAGTHSDLAKPGSVISLLPQFTCATCSGPLGPHDHGWYSQL